MSPGRWDSDGFKGGGGSTPCLQVGRIVTVSRRGPLQVSWLVG